MAGKDNKQKNKRTVAPQNKMPVQNSRFSEKNQTIPNKSRSAQGKQPISDHKKPVQGKQPIPDRKKPVQGKQPISDRKKPVQGMQPIFDHKKPVQGKQPIPNRKKPVQKKQAPNHKKPVQEKQQAPNSNSSVNGRKKPSPEVLRGSKIAAKAMRQKKAAPQSSKFKGGNYILYYLLGAVALIITFVILANTVLFRCSRIEVSGSERYTADEIAAASGVQIGDNLMQINELQSEEKIMNTLAYIDKAEVKKSFPKKVTITVSEGEKWFCIVENNVTAVVSRGGKIIEISLPDKLPVIRGYEPESLEPGKWLQSKTEEKTELPKIIFEAADNAELDKITEIDITDRFNIKVVVEGRINLELGPITDVETKLKVAQKIITTQIGETEYVTLLLTNPEKVPSITNTPPSSSTSTETSSEPQSISESESEDQPVDENDGDMVGNEEEAGNEPWEEPDVNTNEDEYIGDNEPAADEEDIEPEEPYNNESGDELDDNGGNWGDTAVGDNGYAE